MQRFGLIYSQSWYVNLPQWQKELVRTSFELYSREERTRSNFSDYSFLVFPMAKAYEGYIKHFLYSASMISQSLFNDHRFRIGRALNPDVHPDRQDEFWLYGRVSRYCGEDLARLMWNTWLECRNQVFHYFPDNEKRLTLDEAAKKLEMIATTIDQTHHCQTQHLT